MAKYQHAISALLILCSVFSLVGIGRTAMTGWDRITWAAFGAMFVLAWLARRMIMRMPIAAEAGQRARAGPTWSELSPMRRRFLLWFDWPLFIQIREREARRLMDEPIVSATFASNSMALRPLDPSHTEPYFLKWMANAATGYGLKVRNVKEHIFGREIAGNQVELDWSGDDRRIWDYLQATLHDGAPLKLTTFIDTLEAGYLSTLSPAEQHRYFMDRR